MMTLKSMVEKAVSHTRFEERVQPPPMANTEQPDF